MSQDDRRRERQVGQRCKWVEAWEDNGVAVKALPDYDRGNQVEHEEVYGNPLGVDLVGEVRDAADGGGHACQIREKPHTKVTCQPS